ncbi:hypothetical protein KAR91_17450 [Candidatus Pacearchaeota archaeon]|nr:hypothetical protein [Candidatus Pacearchaeota archaeon]
MKHQPYTPQIGDLKVAQGKGDTWRIYAYRMNHYRNGFIWSELGFNVAYENEIAAVAALLAHLEREEETGIKVR